MREKILINALEEIKEGKGRYNSDRFTHASNTIEDMKEIATKALSDYASQKEGLETPSQIFFKHLDKQRKKGDALLFKHIEPVIYAAMEEYAAQFTSSAPESGGEEVPVWKEKVRSLKLGLSVGEKQIKKQEQEIERLKGLIEMIKAYSDNGEANQLLEKIWNLANEAGAPLPLNENRCKHEQVVEKFFGLPDTVNEKTEIKADFGLLVNLVVFAYSEYTKLIDSAFVAGRSKISWQQFAKENGLTDK